MRKSKVVNSLIAETRTASIKVGTRKPNLVNLLIAEIRSAIVNVGLCDCQR